MRPLGDEFHGLTEDQVLQRIEAGESINQIAATLGVNRSNLWRWLEADSQRSARAKSSRMISAQAWEEKAEDVLKDADNPFALAKARELAHHYRWRASKISPAYGEKIQTEHSGTVEVVSKEQRDAAVKAAMRADE
jgi:transposase-like protein